MKPKLRNYISFIVITTGFFYMMGPMMLTIDLASGQTIDAAGIPWSEQTTHAKVFNTFGGLAMYEFLTLSLFIVWQEIAIPLSQGTLKRKRPAKKMFGKTITPVADESKPHNPPPEIISTLPTDPSSLTPEEKIKELVEKLKERK